MYVVVNQIECYEEKNVIVVSEKSCTNPRILDVFRGGAFRETALYEYLRAFGSGRDGVRSRARRFLFPAANDHRYRSAVREGDFYRQRRTIFACADGVATRNSIVSGLFGTEKTEREPY
jgi:hypothetical protein